MQRFIAFMVTAFMVSGCNVIFNQPRVGIGVAATQNVGTRVIARTPAPVEEGRPFALQNPRQTTEPTESPRITYGTIMPSPTMVGATSAPITEETAPAPPPEPVLQGAHIKLVGYVLRSRRNEGPIVAVAQPGDYLIFQPKLGNDGGLQADELRLTGASLDPVIVVDADNHNSYPMLFGDLSAGQSRLSKYADKWSSMEGIELDILKTCPHGHKATFTVTATDAHSNTWKLAAEVPVL